MDLVAQAKVLRAAAVGRDLARRQRARHPRRRARARRDQQGPRQGRRERARSARTSSSASPSSRSAARRCASGSRTSRCSRAGVHGAVRARERRPARSPSTTTSMQALVSRKWPGNVRELKNVVERSAILSRRPRDHRGPARRTRTRARSRRRASSVAAERPRTLDADRRRVGERRARAAGAAGAAPGGAHLTLREFREKSERQYIVDTLRDERAGTSRARPSCSASSGRTSTRRSARIRSSAAKADRGRSAMIRRPPAHGRRPADARPTGRRRSSRGSCAVRRGAARVHRDRRRAAPGARRRWRDAGYAVDAALLPGHGTGAEQLQDLDLRRLARRVAPPRARRHRRRTAAWCCSAIRSGASWPCRSPASSRPAWRGCSSWATR